jgi:hypothetical protein
MTVFLAFVLFSRVLGPDARRSKPAVKIALMGMLISLPRRRNASPPLRFYIIV